jgi:hypothetical protein
MFHSEQTREVSQYRQCTPCTDTRLLWVGGVPVTLHFKETCCETVHVRICQ